MQVAMVSRFQPLTQAGHMRKTTKLLLILLAVVATNAVLAARRPLSAGTEDPRYNKQCIDNHVPNVPPHCYGLPFNYCAEGCNL